MTTPHAKAKAKFENTPHRKVTAKFETKEKLVAAVQALATDELWVPRLASDRVGEDEKKGAKGLAHVSNSKLLRLHETLSTVKEKFGSRSKLIDSVLELAGRAKDAGFRARLEGYPVPRLYDMFRAQTKKKGIKAQPAAAEEAPAKKKAAKKATAKKATAKKAAAKTKE